MGLYDSLDPARALELGGNPELAGIARDANFERRIANLEAKSREAVGYVSAGYYSTTWMAGYELGDGLVSTDVFVRDIPGSLVEVFAQVRARAVSPGIAYVRLEVTDGTVNTTGVVMLGVQSAAYVRRVTLPGSTTGNPDPSGGWLVFPIEMLKDAGILLDRPITFRFRYFSQGGALSEWIERKLWVRVR